LDGEIWTAVKPGHLVIPEADVKEISLFFGKLESIDPAWMHQVETASAVDNLISRLWLLLVAEISDLCGCLQKLLLRNIFASKLFFFWAVE
jgi:hypothetical protein